MPTKPTLPAPHGDFFMDRNMTYLNVGSLGPSPRAALECAAAAWRSLEADKVSRYAWSGGLPETVRNMSTKMLGRNISMDEMAHFPSTTSGLNAVADGLVSTGYFRADSWAGGRPPRVLTTDQEHGGGVAAWQHYVRVGLLAGVDTVALDAPPASGDAVEDAFRAALRAQPNGTYAVLFFSHVLTTTGLALPATRLCALAHTFRALCIVDGAQSVGNVRVLLDETGADAYTVSAHKWLLAPTGSGLLYVSHAARPHIQPTYLDAGMRSYTQCTGSASAPLALKRRAPLLAGAVCRAPPLPASFSRSGPSFESRL